MRAVFTSEPGGMERTRLQEVPEPNRGGPRILVEVRAAALNPADRFLIDGQYPGGPKPPFIVGRDASGVVLESDRPDEFPVGCRVLTLQSSATDLTNGTLCERQQFSPDVLTRIPVGWSFAEAAAAPLVFQTALQALTCAGELPSDGVVLVTGAGGGVGLAAVQLALAMKLRAWPRIWASGSVRRSLWTTHPAPVPMAASLSLCCLRSCLSCLALRSSVERGNISTASKPWAAARVQPAARSSQKTNGPPRVSGTREMVTAL